MDITYNNIFQRTKGRLAQFKVCQKEILLEDICRKKLDYLPELAKPTLQFGQLGPFFQTPRQRLLHRKKVAMMIMMIAMIIMVILMIIMTKSTKTNTNIMIFFAKMY